LVDTFSTSSQGWLQGSTPKSAQMLLIGFRPSVVTFYAEQKSKMSTLAHHFV